MEDFEGNRELNAERRRLEKQRRGEEDWRLWGPYLAERAWGTVREDYSTDGTAWEYFDHDQARSRVYRWSEDGLGGMCDVQQRLCLAFAMWNGKDPILKERAFGLTGNQGNRGEDVKEYYFYRDATRRPATAICVIFTSIRSLLFPIPGWSKKTRNAADWNRRLTC